MYNNTGVMSRSTLCIYILFSIFLGVLHFTGWMAVPLIAMFVPIAYVIVRHSLFSLLVNAFHFALHRFDEDCIINEGVAEARLQQGRMTDAVTLDADKFLRSLRADDEQAGRA